MNRASDPLDGAQRELFEEAHLRAEFLGPSHRFVLARRG